MTTGNPTRKNSALLIVLLFAQLLLMSGSVRHADGATLLEIVTVRATSPIAWLASQVSGGVRGGLAGIRETLAARSENAWLRQDVRRLSLEVGRLQEEALENRRLRRLLRMREDLAPESIGARVVTANLTGQTRVLVIDRGRKDGVEVDQAVIAWGGAVGRVVYADAAFAKVRLLSDPDSGVAGMVRRSRAEGLVFGRRDGPLELVYVSRFADVVLGDVVVTSGLDGVFPRGFTIGRVTFAGRDDEVSKTVRIQPAVDYRGLEEVLVIREHPGGLSEELPEIERPR